MTLSEKYKEFDLRTLIEIVESEHDYTRDAVNTAKDELNKRPHISDSIVVIAKEFMRKRLIDLLDSFDVFNSKLSLPVSHFLDEEQVLELFKEVFIEWQTERKDMTPDSWKYIVGAII